MDLLSSIRKSGSRGGVNFSWDSVTTSQHRENYLGHSLMAPVGRWQKGRDLNWYAKADDDGTAEGESIEEKRIRERKEEMRRIKEAEEDALAKALGLPVVDRTGSGGITSGANNVGLGLGKGELKRVIGEVEEGDQEIEEVGRGRGFGGFVGKIEGEGETKFNLEEVEEKGGLIGGASKKAQRERSGSRERRHRRHRHRSQSAERHRYRSRSGERHRHRRRHEEREDRKGATERRETRYRSRSPERRRGGRDDLGRDVGRRDRRDDSRRDEPRGDGRRGDDFRRGRPGREEPRRDESKRNDARREGDRNRRRSRSPDFRGGRD